MTTKKPFCLADKIFNEDLGGNGWIHKKDIKQAVKMLKEIFDTIENYSGLEIREEIDKIFGSGLTK
jgi:hypothetical protein